MLKHGLVQVYTGDGKGKTTAAFGQALRALGNGFKVCIFQFFKDDKSKSGELILEQKFKGQLKIVRGHQTHPMFTKGKPQKNLKKEINRMFMDAKEAVMKGGYDIVILDEVNNCISDDFLELHDLFKLIDSKPKNVELILTGRNAPGELTVKADLVTNMIMMKHPFKNGVKARKGIEY